MTVSSPCAEPRCRRKTRDGSGRCHDHRRSTRASSASSLPVPRSSTGPTKVERVRNDTIIETYENAYGAAHRIDGPAIVIRRQGNGVVASEEWVRDGIHHRADGPAWTVRRDDGTLHSEEYYRLGRPYRLDGPAMLVYLSDGKTLDYERWMSGDDEYEDPAPFYAAVREAHSDDELAAELEETPLAELLEEGRSPTAVLDALATGVRTPGGIREVLDGAPAEWVRAYEESRS